MDQSNETQKNLQPPQHQDRQPGLESEMTPEPIFINPNYKPANKLAGKVAIITGGDSGIGRATAVMFAQEGANVTIVYLDEHGDADKTSKEIDTAGGTCLAIAGDVGDESFCQRVVDETVKTFGRVDVLINNAAEQHPQTDIRDISAAQLERTFRTNIFAYFFMVKAAVPHLKAGSTIINTASVTAYRGSSHLLDYSSTKGAIVAYTRSLAQSLADKEIRVNAVAPGPIWTPLIPSTFPPEEVARFGADTLMKRAGQPAEVAPCFVFLASEDSSYVTGQVLHPNGGEIVNT